MRCGLDERPAQIARTLLWEVTAKVAFAGLVDAGAEAAVAGEFARSGEARDVADLGGDRVGEHPADPGHGQQQRDVAVVGAEPAQLALALVDLAVELVDEAQAGLDRPLPGLGQAELGEQPTAAQTEQVGRRGRACRG